MRTLIPKIKRNELNKITIKYNAKNNNRIEKYNWIDISINDNEQIEILTDNHKNLYIDLNKIELVKTENNHIILYLFEYIVLFIKND